MRIDAKGKVWATWREWMKIGRIDAQKGITPRYPAQPDYMAGYESQIKKGILPAEEKRASWA